MYVRTCVAIYIRYIVIDVASLAELLITSQCLVAVSCGMVSSTCGSYGKLVVVCLGHTGGRNGV